MTTAETDPLSTAASAPVVYTTWIESGDGRPLLRYILELEGRLLTVQWEPDLTIAEGEIGIRAVTRIIQQHGCVGVLTDTSRNRTDWTDLVPLFLYEELPKALAAGLRFQASVVALNPNDALAQHELNEEIHVPFTNCLFNDASPARHWLLTKLGA